jgi:hypothetical protein
MEKHPAPPWMVETCWNLPKMGYIPSGNLTILNIFHLYLIYLTNGDFPQFF